MTITIDLSPEEEQRLQLMAAQQGTDAQEIVLQAVKRLLPRPKPTLEDIAAADDELFSHIVYAPYAVGADNESIDEDLIAAYENKVIPSVERRRANAD